MGERSRHFSCRLNSQSGETNLVRSSEGLSLRSISNLSQKELDDRCSDWRYGCATIERLAQLRILRIAESPHTLHICWLLNLGTGLVSRHPFLTANVKIAPSSPVTRLALPGESERMKFSTFSLVTDATFNFPSFGRCAWRSCWHRSLAWTLFAIGALLVFIAQFSDRRTVAERLQFRGGVFAYGHVPEHLMGSSRA